MQTVEQNQEETAVVAANLIPKGRFVEAIGRRKTAVARVRVWEEKSAKRGILVNDREVFEYFPAEETREAAKEGLDGEWKKKLKKAGLLKPDTRIVERKKFGKKKARKSPQWSKR